MQRHALVAAFMGIAALTASAPTAAQQFVFHLSADQEVPPTASPARGGCHGEFDAGSSQLALNCVHDLGGITVGHIHRGPAGLNGPILFDLGTPASPIVATWSGLTPADVADLLAGNLYVNLHDATFPGGAIRGQMLARTVDMVAFVASGTQVVPPDPTAASAVCVADLDVPATSIAVQCTHDVPAPIAAHVHDAPAGQNGPTVFTFPSAASPLVGNAPLTPLQVASFAASFLYLDIHGDDTIRGQIGALPPPPPAPSVTGTKTFDSDRLAGSSVTYTIVLTNAGAGTQGDNPGDEFVDVLPPALQLMSANASSGSATLVGNTVSWNGTIAPGASVTITILATITASTPAGTLIANQGAFTVDTDGNGTNDGPRVTDDPATAAAGDATGFVVPSSRLIAIPAGGDASGGLLAAALALTAMFALRRRRAAHG